MPAGIEDRNADIWESLLAIADAVGGDWPEKARVAAVALVAAAVEVEPSLGVRLLADLRTVFADSESMPTTAILAALQMIPEAPWSDIKGKPLNERGLAVRLRQYGIRSQDNPHRPAPKVWRRGTPAPTSGMPGSVTSPRHPTEPKQATQTYTNPDLWAKDGPSVSDVSDSVAVVSDGNGAGSADKTASVSDVSDVSDFPGNGGEGRICAQCGSGSEPLEPFHNGKQLVMLHRECTRFWH